jgi:flavin-dependent dehydrogenase
VFGPQHCDVLVLGGGPAGTATALALQAHGVATLVVERSQYDIAHPGELLLGDTEPILRKLGVWPPFLATGPAMARLPTSVWGGAQPGERTPELDLFAPGWQIDRLWFDALLARSAEAARALVYCGIHPSCVERTHAGWRLTMRSDSATAVVQARYLVDATGRVAWLARQMGSARQRVDRLVGLVAHLRAWSRRWRLARRGGAQRLVVFRVARRSAHGSGLPDRRRPTRTTSPAEVFLSCLKQTERTRERSDSIGEPESVHLVSAETSALERCIGERWLAIGDAAFSLDPLSGSGIRRALESGLRAAEVIASELRGNVALAAGYQAFTTEYFTSQLQARRHYYGLERRSPQSRFWSRRS